MQENIKDKETCRFMYPTGIVSSVFLFSDRALQWLCGTTTDDGGRTAGNFTLLGDLLARMALTTEEAKGFRGGTAFRTMEHRQKANTELAG